MPVRQTAVILLLTLCIAAGIACGPKRAGAGIPTAAEVFAAEARVREQPPNAAEGSIWNSSARRTDLFRDFKARDINDIVMIRVVESTQALSSADARNAKSTAATAGFDNLFGAEKVIKELPTIIGGKSDNSFEGSGSTSRTTTLQTTLTARVIDVLPSGYLVVEGVREIHVNNENQNIYLTGVIRPEDINRDNIVPSSAVAQMTVRIQGRGMVSQPLKPGWLYRILNGVLPF